MLNGIAFKAAAEDNVFGAEGPEQHGKHDQPQLTSPSEGSRSSWFPLLLGALILVTVFRAGFPSCGMHAHPHPLKPQLLWLILSVFLAFTV